MNELNFNDYDDETKQEAMSLYLDAHPEIAEEAGRRAEAAVRERYRDTSTDHLRGKKGIAVKEPLTEYGSVELGGNVANSQNGQLKWTTESDFTNGRPEWHGKDSGAKPGPRPNRWGVSTFSADGRGNFTSREWNPEEGERVTSWGAAADANAAALVNSVRRDQRTSYDEFAGVSSVGQRNQARKELEIQNASASLMKLASGGVVRPEAIALYNRKFGLKGENALLGAYYTQGGDFVMDFAQGRDQFGNVRHIEQHATPMMQYEMMNNQTGIFNDEERASMRERLKDRGYSDKELDVFQTFGESYGRSGVRGGGTRGGLDYEQTMARDAAKYDSYRFKNMLDAFKSNMEWQQLLMKEPEKAMGMVYKAAGMTQNGGTGAPAPKPGDELQTVGDKAKAAALEEAKKTGRRVGAAQGADAPVRGVKTPVPTAANTEGLEDSDVEKGNLSHKGRKWKFYTDKDGKVNGYGTTRSMVTKTDDGRYAVIPTIVDGEELTAEEAVKHFKETGEHWGIEKSEDAAKKLANKVHYKEQKANMKEWNDWLHDNWDKVSPEITNDEGMAKEHQRRKYEQKISDMGLSDEFENYVESEKQRVKKTRNMGYEIKEESRENLAKQFIREQEGSVVKKLGEGIEKFGETMEQNPNLMEEAQKKARSIR